MSGIVGVHYGDGRPVNKVEIESMARAIAARGPDGLSTWISGSVGFGHSALHTTHESVRERQPRSLDGVVWITADARVDARADLVRKLVALGRRDVGEATDDELILHAYHAWGSTCVDHLLGDFSFAIWDGRARHLFCARDHLGVKPFYYSHVRDNLIFSNSFSALRHHQLVSSDLDDQTIADCLLFRRNGRLDATGFADVQRLPPAHCALVSDKGLRIWPYWKASIGEERRCGNPRQVIEEFHELFRLAVTDRLRTNRVAVTMSGGLDSTAVTAKAIHVLRNANSAYQLDAYTMVYDHLIPDEERRYSSLAADALGVPIHHFPVDHYALFDRMDEPQHVQSEPQYSPQVSAVTDLMRLMACNSRVVLTGWDGDMLMKENPHFYLKFLLRQGKYGRSGMDIFRYWRATGTFPKLGIRSRIRQVLSRQRPVRQPLPFPKWVKEDFSEQLGLRARWLERGEKARNPVIETRRPNGWLGLGPGLPSLSGLFDAYDANSEGIHLEYRHPLLDLRLLEFLLSLPAIPWCINKHILRKAHENILPDAVLRRPKTTLRGDPVWAKYLQSPIQLNDFTPMGQLNKYVATESIPAVASRPSEFWLDSRPLMLNYWLYYQRLSPLGVEVTT